MKQLIQNTRRKATHTTACILSVAALLLGGCTQNDLPGTDGADGSAYGLADLRIASAKLKAPEEQPLSRAVATEVLTTGSIGLFRSQGTGYAETQANKKYTYDAAKGWQPAAAADTVYLMANDADVCAYYPYNAAYTDKTVLPLASGKYAGTADDQTKHDPADLCYAVNRSMNGATASTELVMQHAMAMVKLSFTRLNYASTACNITSVTMKNTELVATSTINITDGTYGTAPVKAALKWTPGTADPATGIQVPATGSVSTSALLVPCTLDATAATTFSFTVDGQTMSVKVPASKLPALQAGKIHSLKFVVHASSITLSEVSIVDWWREWDTANEPTVDAGTKDYIELAGVKWAIADLTYNAAYYTYSFASSAVVSGTKMQWNTLSGTDEGNKTKNWLDYQDPCTRLEPKGTWVTPTKEEFATLLTVPRAWTDDYNGVKGQWFGTNDAAEAALNPNRYLFLSTGTAAVAGYWTQTYGTQNNPQSFFIMKGNAPIEEDLVAYNTPLNVRCMQKPQKVYKPIDIGLPFLIAPGNLVAEGSLGNVTGYRFAEEQGWFSGDYANGGDYFCRGVIDPFVSKGTASVTDPFVDACKQMGEAWRTPTVPEFIQLTSEPQYNGTYTYTESGSEKTVDGWWIGTSSQPAANEQQKYVFLAAAGCTNVMPDNGYWQSKRSDSYPNQYGYVACLYSSASICWGGDASENWAYEDTKAPIRCICDK